jgi:hypothetical protein
MKEMIYFLILVMPLQEYFIKYKKENDIRDDQREEPEAEPTITIFPNPTN